MPWLARTCRVALVVAAAARAAAAQADTLASSLTPARLFGDGLVLQRGAVVPVWGWAPPKTSITVVLSGQTRMATADAHGAWRVSFPAMNAGGPYEMTIAGGGRRIAVRDILVGDVWVASGQSNMEWPVASSVNAAAEISSANDAKIREFAVPHSYSEHPEADVVGGAWAHADSQHVGHFSGVAYFFARDLRKSVDVPIGIIHTSWGGANIETWMSRAALGMTDSAWRAAMSSDRAHNDSVRAALQARIGDLPTADAGLVGERAVWADPMLSDASWATIKTPALWETVGYDGMDGVAWYRTSFTLTDDEARQAVRLSLGPIDDSDITWVNGVEVGRERNAASRSRSPNVGAPSRDFLQRHVPAARHEPLRNEVNGGGFRAGGRIDREEFRGERDDVGHDGKVSRSKNRRDSRRHRNHNSPDKTRRRRSKKRASSKHPAPSAVSSIASSRRRLSARPVSPDGILESVRAIATGSAR